MIKWKQISSLVLATGMVLSMTACGGSGNDTQTPATNAPAATDAAGSEEASTGTNLEDLKLGDYADLTANIKLLTNRTDLIDTAFKDYVAKFNEIYPNITVEVSGETDYESTVITRLTTPDWGTICMIPNGVQKSELSTYFEPLGSTEKLSENYEFMTAKEYQGTVYGIPSLGNASGIVYNKKVFEKAGITELPKTPDEFLDALQKIKDNTDAIPMYSNFAAGWTMGAWDDYIASTATGDATYKNQKLVHTKDPFAKRDDMTGPYAVYYILYEATARGLIEDNPVTSDWEDSKPMMNNGEIGTMVLGSWAVSEMQEAGPNPDDVAYMPFPITQPDGKQYAGSGADYAFAVNVNATDDEKLAAKLFIKWMTEESGYAYSQGGIPIVKGAEKPDTLAAFEGVELLVDAPALEGEEDLFDTINNESEVGINSDDKPDADILEAAMDKSKTLDEIMAEWNQKWSDAQESEGVEVQY